MSVRMQPPAIIFWSHGFFFMGDNTIQCVTILYRISKTQKISLQFVAPKYLYHIYTT